MNYKCKYRKNRYYFTKFKTFILFLSFLSFISWTTLLQPSIAVAQKSELTQKHHELKQLLEDSIKQMAQNNVFHGPYIPKDIHGFFIFTISLLSNDSVIQFYIHEWKKWIQTLIRIGNSSVHSYIVKSILQKESVIQQYPENWMKWVQTLIRGRYNDSSKDDSLFITFKDFKVLMDIVNLLSNDFVIQKSDMWAKLVKELIKKSKPYILLQENIIDKVLSKQLAMAHPQWLTFIRILRRKGDSEILRMTKELLLKHKAEKKSKSVSENLCKILFS